MPYCEFNLTAKLIHFKKGEGYFMDKAVSKLVKTQKNEGLDGRSSVAVFLYERQLLNKNCGESIWLSAVLILQPLGVNSY
ncbi:MAG: hypothetical protein JJT77_12865 [Crocinitomicaceae bacterium]|nr:hypothetical protein [Crocinitomicaceae bacterium]